MASRAALEGERKQVTALFADLRGSMDLLEGLDPEEARRVMDPAVQLMMDGVHRYEGTVNHVLGDGIMALFGAPIAHEDAPRRALYAALAIRDSVSRYGEQVRREKGAVVQVRVGINSGEVVVRSIGSDLRLDYSAVGHAVGLAARMESLAKPDSILVTGGTHALTEDYFRWSPLGPIAVKGSSQPVEAYELLGPSDVRTRLQAGARRGLTPFVGRSHEMEHMKSTLELAKRGQGQVASVVGDPGVGKSRLFLEFKGLDRVGGCLILEGSSVSFGRATAYLPLIDVLRGYFRIDGDDGPEQVREKVIGRLLALDESLRDTVPRFLDLLAEGEDQAAEDADHRRRLRTEAVKRLFFRESVRQPVILIFEDMHWVDDDTLALISSLVEGLATSRLLLLTNFRPEFTPPWTARTYFSLVRLDPLAEESAAELLSALLGTASDLKDLRAMLLRRAGGNPFFTEELVRSLVEREALVGAPGAYRPAGDLSRLDLPPTVQGVLAARIDRLEPDAKRTLQTAAVIGKDFASPLLERVSDLEPDVLAASLDVLKDAEFIYEQSIYPEVEYTFKHALTQEVAAQGLLAERRRELHGRVGEAIESLYPARLDEHVGALAHHFAQSGDQEKAVHYLHRAGVRAGRLGAWPEAMGLLEDARTRARDLPASEERDRGRMAVLRTLAMSVLFFFEEGWEAYLEGIDEELTEVATSLGAFGELAWTFSARSVPLGFLMGARGALRCVEKVRALAGLLPDEDAAWYGGYAEALAHYLRGEFRATVAKVRELLERPDVDHLAPPAELSVTTSPAAALGVRAALSLDSLGEFAEAERLAERFREEAAKDGTALRLGFLRAVEGLHHLALGRAEPAARTLAEAVGYHEQAGFRRGSAGARSRLGQALTELGRFEQAAEVLSEALESLGGADWSSAFVFPRRARAYLGAGHLEEARRDAETGVVMTRQFENRAGEGEAHLSLALVLGASEPPDYAAAEREFAEAEQCLRECEYRTELALTLRCHGEMRLKTGGPAAAGPLLEEARTLYAWMGRERDVAAVEALLGRAPSGPSPAAARSRDG
ncbi:MAG: adenylate/guanylate cyclase domain-containing protein [Dehalococcoidia bacterium]|nr:adenylate/guanylate cyclase domain-containing protein [Dehalococcoidia bacterium]